MDGATTYAVGIDLGSTNTKVAVTAIAADAPVRELSVFSAPTPTAIPQLRRVIAKLLRAAVEASPGPPRAVGIASMAETGVPLDADDEALCDLVRWNAGASAEDAAALARELGRVALFEATGVVPSGKVPLATWARLRRTHPALWAGMSRWAGVADVVALALTGRLVTDHTLAGRTMAYRLPRAGDPLPDGFDADLLSAVGLTPDRLPRVAAPGEVAGHVTRNAADLTGLPVGIPVIIAGHDHAVGAWAAGMRGPGNVVDSVGTAEALLRVPDITVTRPAVLDHGISLTRTINGEFECLLAGSASAGAMVQEWHAGYAAAGSGPAAPDPGSDRPTPGPSGLILLPYLRGRQSPAPDASARVRLLDLAGREVSPDAVRPAVLAAALYEGLAWQARWMFETERELAGGAPDTPVTVIGGSGAHNAAWMNTKAALMPVPLRIATPRQPVAMGAALLAAVRAGLLDGTPTLPSRAISEQFPEQPPEWSESVRSRTFAAFLRAATGRAATEATVTNPAATNPNTTQPGTAQPGPALASTVQPTEISSVAPQQGVS